MSVLDWKILRELRGHWGVLLAISSIMGIGVAAFVALNSAYRNLTLAQQHYYAQCRMADFTIELKKMPTADVAAIAAIPGVVEVRPRIQFYTTVDIESMLEPVNGLVLSLPDRQQSVIDNVLLRRGGYFTDRRDNEVIVGEAFARRHGLHPGMWIHLLLNNQRQELFIVGTAISSEFTYQVGPGSIVPDPEHFGVFYVKHTFAENAFNFDGAANQLLGVLSPAYRGRTYEVLRKAEMALAPYGVASTTPLRDQPSHRFIDNEIKGLRAFGVINPGIFLSVASMVLNVLMSRLAEQQRSVIGTLKALGYDNMQVFAHFVKFGLSVGLAGGLGGCALGYFIAMGMTGMYQMFFQFPSLVARVYADVCLLGIGISLACSLLGSVLGARKVLKLDPAEAMRAKPPVQGGAVWLERVAWLWNQLSFGWRMTLRNVIRNRLRTAAGIFAAAMGAAVSVDAIMLTEAIRYMVDFQFQWIMRSDYDLVFKEEKGRAAWDDVRRLPGVDWAEPLLDIGCTFVNGSHTRKGGITGLVPGARLTIPRDSAGQPLQIAPTGLTITRKLAEMLHVKKGDILVIEPTRGQRRPRSVPVAEIADSFIGVASYAEIGYLSRLVNEEFAMTGAQLSVEPGAATRRDLFRELKRLPVLQAVAGRSDMIENVNETLVKNQTVFIGLLVMFAGVIFFGSVLNSSLVSLAERSREVATLRVLGYSEWQIGGLFLRESVLVNVAGTLAGLPLGYLLNYGITIAYDTEMFRIPVVNPVGVMLFVLLLGTVFGLLAHVIVQRSIFKMDWLDALKTKE